MSKFLKKIILITIIILLIFILLIIVYFLIKSKNNVEDFSHDSEFVTIDIETNKNKVEYEKNKNTYFTVISIIENYINEEDKFVLLDMFDPKYRESYGIMVDNVSEIDLSDNEDIKFKYYYYTANKFYCVNNGTINTFFISGYYYTNINPLAKKDLNIMVELDNVNQTFNIYKDKYIVDNKYDELKIGDIINTRKDEITDRNNNNKFQYIAVTQEEMANNYLLDYKNKILYDKDNAYRILDEVYSKKRFIDYEDFKRFADDNKIRFFLSNLMEYKVEISETGNNIYICKDQDDNFYYFIETDGIMRYKAILDMYTIDFPEFITTYDSANIQEKVALNIDKIRQALNSSDYNYIYNKLAKDFKDNKYNTKEDFESYIKDTIYDNIYIEYKKFTNEGEIYIYDVGIKNLANKEDEEINMQIIMELKDNRDFIFSFSIKD